jgi:hypothetical protein
LVEPAATNLVLRSEEFDNASWSKLNGATVTANTSVAPDGTTTADTLTLNTNISSSVAQAITTISELTFSVYAKVASGTKNFRLRFDRPSVIASANFTATTTWQRFTFTATTTGNGSVYVINDSTGTAGDLIIWGAQLETGSVATSYIPTVAATATRNADVISKTGVSGFIGQTEGTLFIDLDYNQPPNDPNGRLLQIYATNDTTNAILPLINGAGANVNQFQLSTFSSGSPTVAITASAATIVPFGQNKFAIAYNAGSYTVYRNGSLFASGTGLVPISFTAINLGGSLFAARSINNRIRAAAIYPTRLSNAELAALTTL